mmetsp:Transcript_11309/g.21164  ORF Transcript_11309/g.21164 Transcript_11309/m.21164 type:complete len:329 (-) Transcript_11309:209-1195(-)
MERFNPTTDDGMERPQNHHHSSSHSSPLYPTSRLSLEYEMEPHTDVSNTINVSLPSTEDVNTKRSSSVTRLMPSDSTTALQSSTINAYTGGHYTLAERGHDNLHPPLCSHDPNQSTADEAYHEMKNNQEKQDFNYDDEEIQRDAANEIVALVVHIAIGFFMILFFGSLIVSVFIVSKYGFMTFILIMLLMTMALTIGYFVSKIMDKDEVLRPVRRKIQRWHAVATAVVIKEIQDFHLDLNEHLLLTNGSVQEEDVDDRVYEMMDEDGRWNGQGSTSRRARGRRGGHRSKVFGFLVKPFLKEKNGKKFRFRKQKKTEDNEDVHCNVEMT